jgi:carboxymethylenebutenolidase
MKPLLVLFILILAGGMYWYQRTDTQARDAISKSNVDMLQSDVGVPVVTENVTYFNDVRGYFVRPESEGTYPGVVMIHEWWGLNENIKQMAKQLAAEGYQVLAVDLHGEVATTSERARELTGALDQDEALENLRAATAFLRDRGAEKVASLGWCFGGGQSMQLSLSGEPLDATVIYYGSLVTDQAELEKIQWPVLGVFGAEDQSIPVETVTAFDAALDAAGVQNDIHVYPGVGHAFANPSGQNYAPTETQDAWAKTMTFLQENLQ